MHVEQRSSRPPSPSNTQLYHHIDHTQKKQKKRMEDIRSAIRELSQEMYRLNGERDVSQYAHILESKNKSYEDRINSLILETEELRKLLEERKDTAGDDTTRRAVVARDGQSGTKKKKKENQWKLQDYLLLAVILLLIVFVVTIIAAIVIIEQKSRWINPKSLKRTLSSAQIIAAAPQQSQVAAVPSAAPTTFASSPSTSALIRAATGGEGGINVPAPPNPSFLQRISGGRLGSPQTPSAISDISSVAPTQIESGVSDLLDQLKVLLAYKAVQQLPTS